MGPVDYLILLIMIVTGVELVIELRRKRWWPAAIAALFLALLTWIGWGIFVYAWRLVTGTP